MELDYYEYLGVSNDATKDEIKSAYFKLVRKYPPEKCPDEFNWISIIYSILSDDEKRQKYDMYNNEILKNVFSKINKGCYEEAYVILKSTIDKGDNLEEVYFRNFYVCAIKLNKVHEAEIYLKKAILIFNNASLKILLFDLYLQKDIKIASDFLENKLDPCIEDGSLTIYDLILLSKMSFYADKKNLSIKYLDFFIKNITEESFIESFDMFISCINLALSNMDINIAINYLNIMKYNLTIKSDESLKIIKYIEVLLIEARIIINNEIICNEIKVFVIYKIMKQLEGEETSEDFSIKEQIKVINEAVRKDKEKIKKSIKEIEINCSEISFLCENDFKKFLGGEVKSENNKLESGEGSGIALLVGIGIVIAIVAWPLVLAALGIGLILVIIGALSGES